MWLCSPKYFPPAHTPWRRKAALVRPWAICPKTTGISTFTIPSKGRTGWETKTPSNTCAAKPPRWCTSWNTWACRLTAMLMARFTSAPLVVTPPTTVKSQFNVLALLRTELATPCCTRFTNKTSSPTPTSLWSGWRKTSSATPRVMSLVSPR